MVVAEISTRTAASTVAGELARHLERNAAEYFHASGEARVRRMQTRRRRNATLYYFDVRLADSSRAVVVKVPYGRNQARGPRRPLPDELRSLPISSSDERGDLEHRTLAWIHSHFADRDPRFGAIRVLDYLPGKRALVMEWCPDRNLQDLYARSVGPRRGLGRPAIERALRNAGAWLRAYHGLPAPSGCRERMPLRDDFLGLLSRMCDFLLEDASDGDWISRIETALRERALATLPERLPLVTAHGDFVPRNVLVGVGGRVTMLDTRAQWRAPPYEDLARFRIALSSGNAQLATPDFAFDRSLPERCSAELLAGYFGDEVPPLEVIRLFEAQRLLSIRVAAAYQVRIARGPRRLAKLVAFGIRSRYVTQELRKRLPEAGRA